MSRSSSEGVTIGRKRARQSSAEPGRPLLARLMRPFGTAIVRHRIAARERIRAVVHSAWQPVAQWLQQWIDRQSRWPVPLALVLRAHRTHLERQGVAPDAVGKGVRLLDEQLRHAGCRTRAPRNQVTAASAREACINMHPDELPRSWMPAAAAVHCGCDVDELRLALAVPPVHNVVITGDMGIAVPMACMVANVPVRSRCGPSIGPGKSVLRDSNQPLGINKIVVLTWMGGCFNAIGARNAGESVLHVAYFGELMGRMLVAHNGRAKLVREVMSMQAIDVCNMVAAVTALPDHGVDTRAMAAGWPHSTNYVPTSCPSLHIAVPMMPWPHGRPPHPLDTRHDHNDAALSGGPAALLGAPARGQPMRSNRRKKKPKTALDALLFDSGTSTVMAGRTRGQQAWTANFVARVCANYPDSTVPMRAAARSARRRAPPVLSAVPGVLPSASSAQRTITHGLGADAMDSDSDSDSDDADAMLLGMQ